MKLYSEIWCDKTSIYTISHTDWLINRKKQQKLKYYGNIRLVSQNLLIRFFIFSKFAIFILKFPLFFLFSISIFSFSLVSYYLSCLISKKNFWWNKFTKSIDSIKEKAKNIHKFKQNIKHNFLNSRFFRELNTESLNVNKSLITITDRYENFCNTCLFFIPLELLFLCRFLFTVFANSDAIYLHAFYCFYGFCFCRYIYIYTI